LLDNRETEYKVIASIIKSEYTRYDNTGEDGFEGKNAVAKVAFGLADFFDSYSIWFNRDKFIKACGIKEELK